jgi:hypothetical protein
MSGSFCRPFDSEDRTLAQLDTVDYHRLESEIVQRSADHFISRLRFYSAYRSTATTVECTSATKLAASWCLDSMVR